MSSFLIGALVGSMTGVVILSLILRLALKHILTGNILIIITVFSAVIASIAIYAFGGAGDGAARLNEAIVLHTLSGVIVMALWLLKKRGRPDADG